MRPTYRYLLVGCLAFLAGSAFGGLVCSHYAEPRLAEIARRMGTLGPPHAVTFDVWATADHLPAPPVYVASLSVLPDEGEALSIHLADQSRINLVICKPDGAVNPCGPDGVQPDDYGAVLLDDYLSGQDAPEPVP